MPETTTNPTLPQAGNSTYRSIAAFISDTQLMLNNTKGNATILAKMTAAGFPEAVIDEKLTELDDLRTLNEQQAAEYGDQFAATEAWKQHYESFFPQYMQHLALARIAFRKDPKAQNALALQGDRKRSQSGYINQAIQFYNNALGIADIKTALANRGITQTALEGGRSELINLQSLREAQQKETGEAQEATKARDAVYDDLHEWEIDFRATAKVVLADTPQLMEEIGIKQAS